MRYGFKSWAEKQSIGHRQRLGLTVHDHLPARVLASELGVVIWAPSDVPNIPSACVHELLVTNSSCWSAVTLPGLVPPVVIHNTSHAPTRQESNLMHELAHVICNHESKGVVLMGGLPCREYNEEQEEEAECFGAALQVPRQGLLVAVRRGRSNDEIARQFGASIDLVRFRRNTCGVDVQIARARQRRMK